MRKFATVVAWLLLIPALAFAGGGEVQTTIVGEQKLTVLSGGKTMATVTLSKGDGGTIRYQANAVRMEAGAAKSTIHVTGKVSLTLIRDGRQAMQIVADEVIIEQARQPAQPMSSK